MREKNLFFQFCLLQKKAGVRSSGVAAWDGGFPEPGW